MNGIPYRPGYIGLHRSGELKKRGNLLWEQLAACRLCPRECGINREKGETGFCNATSRLRVASVHAHFGEERGLVGVGGSGTIFLSHCNLGCVFCQNWDISHGGAGAECSIGDLAAMMLQLQEAGCHNINVVTPTHFSAQIVLALDHAASLGLRLPLVWNTCGWERKEILEILEGVVDIYLADFKYTDDRMAERYSSEAHEYSTITKTALIEMDRQVGVAIPEGNGVIYRGLMIRHLVMPESVSGSIGAMEWISEKLPKETYVNIMIQYRPAYRANLYPEINRPVTIEEYRKIVDHAREKGLTNLDVDI